MTEAIDRSLLAGLAALVEEVTAAFDGYDYARALERTESFFWSFCDDHLELVKGRAYGEHGEAEAASARAALRLALSTLQRLFAPFLPFVTEEVWSWWQEGSIHRSSWPAPGELDTGGDPALLPAVAGYLAAVRRTKSEQKRSQKAPVSAITLWGPAGVLEAVRQAEPDLRMAAGIPDDVAVVYETADEVGANVTLAPE